MSLILASSSPYRKTLLSQLGIEFLTQSPQVDEEALKAKFSGALADLPQHLALEKAKSISQLNPSAIVIGSDQMALLNQDRFDKPGTIAKAEEQLKALRGKTHQLATAVAIGRQDEWLTKTVVTHLKMKDLSDEQIHTYVKVDQPLDCAGAYKVESKGISLFESIDCEDHTAIIGLPLLCVSQFLTQLGLGVPPA